MFGDWEIGEQIGDSQGLRLGIGAKTGLRLGIGPLPGPSTVGYRERYPGKDIEARPSAGGVKDWVFSLARRRRGFLHWILRGGGRFRSQAFKKAEYLPRIFHGTHL